MLTRGELYKFSHLDTKILVYHVYEIESLVNKKYYEVFEVKRIERGTLLSDNFMKQSFMYLGRGETKMFKSVQYLSECCCGHVFLSGGQKIFIPYLNIQRLNIELLS